MKPYSNQDWLVTVTHRSGASVRLGSNSVPEISLWVGKQLAKRKPGMVLQDGNAIVFVNDITIDIVRAAN